MGVFSRWWCKEVCRFPHNITYPYSICFGSNFSAASLTSLFSVLNVFSFFIYIYIMKGING